MKNADCEMKTFSVLVLVLAAMAVVLSPVLAEGSGDDEGATRGGRGGRGRGTPRMMNRRRPRCAEGYRLVRKPAEGPTCVNKEALPKAEIADCLVEVSSRADTEEEQEGPEDDAVAEDGGHRRGRGSQGQRPRTQGGRGRRGRRAPACDMYDECDVGEVSITKTFGDRDVTMCLSCEDGTVPTTKPDADGKYVCPYSGALTVEPTCADGFSLGKKGCKKDE